MRVCFLILNRREEGKLTTLSVVVSAQRIHNQPLHKWESLHRMLQIDAKDWVAASYNASRTKGKADFDNLKALGRSWTILFNCTDAAIAQCQESTPLSLVKACQCTDTAG